MAASETTPSVSSDFRVTVIVCAWNPDPVRFNRVIRSLQDQTLDRREWELLIIDNHSDPALTVDLSWHSSAQIVVETKLGLTHARLTGIDRARGRLLVFVDDDNVLAPDYLARAREIAQSRPWLGAFGGSIVPEYEIEPPAILRDRPWLVACVTVSREAWSNHASPGGCLPVGAGMCVRAEVARAYASLCRNDPMRILLDRQGNNLSSAGDDDLALTACDLGYAAGRFPQLQLTHLIAAHRLNLPYLLRLAEGIARSQILLRSLRPPGVQRPPLSRIESFVRWYARRRLTPDARAFELAWLRGEASAFDFLAARRNSPQSPA